LLPTPHVGLGPAARSKVPLITPTFCVVKGATTAMSACVRLLPEAHGPILAVGLGAGGFTLAMIMQFSTKRHIDFSHWCLLEVTAIIGIMIADAMRQFGSPVPLSTFCLRGIAGGRLLTLSRSEATLSAHSTFTSRNDAFCRDQRCTRHHAQRLDAGTLHLGNALTGFSFLALLLLPCLGF